MSKYTIKHILPLLLVAISLSPVLSSCADKDEIEASPTIKEDEGGLLSIRFSTGGNATTRTASDIRDNVASNYSLNEDKITRLDLFVVDGDNVSIHKSINVKTNINESSSIVSYTDNNTEEETDQLNSPENGVTYVPTWTVPGLTSSSVDGKTVYLIANWTNCPSNISTLSDLQKALTSDNGGSAITPYSNQAGFFMDGKITANKGSNLTSTDDKNYTLSSITLKRAVAKIRITVYLEEKEESDPTVARSLEDITNTSKVTYKLMNYATEGTVLADNSDAVVRCEKGTETDYTSYVTSSIKLKSMDESMAGSSDYLKNNIELVAGPTKISYNGNNYSISNYNSAVFYVYPNDWINPWYRNDDYTLTKQILNPTSLPIIKDRRTYFMLTGVYNNGTYDYTVPVNYQIPTDNDKTKIEDYQDLYQLKRNYIYDVIAILDRQGGQNGLYLRYSENPWTVGNSYSLTDFLALLSFEDNTKVYTMKSDDVNAIKVAYDADNQTGDTPSSSYSPKMTIKVSGTELEYWDGTEYKKMDEIGDKPWIIHTDNPNFGFLVDGETKIVDQISCDAKTTSKTFQLVPKVALDKNSSLLAKVYVTVVSSGASGEIYISTPSDVPMEGNKILFYQVAPSNYKSDE